MAIEAASQYLNTVLDPAVSGKSYQRNAPIASFLLPLADLVCEIEAVFFGHPDIALQSHQGACFRACRRRLRRSCRGNCCSKRTEELGQRVAGPGIIIDH